MAPPLNVVATCTDRKSLTPPAELQARNLPRLGGGRVDVNEWVRRREGADFEAVPARELYQGELWSAMLDVLAAAEAQDRSTSLWVVSAGYGVVAGDAPLPPYAATFSARSRDAVCRSGPSLRTSQDRRTWWKALTTGSVGGAPSTLAELAEDVNDQELLIIMSPAYVDACREDLDAVRAVHQEAVLVTSGGHEPGDSEWAPGYDARVQGQGRPLDGSRISLNARVARHLVEEVEGVLTRDKATTIVEELMRGVPEAPSYGHRRSMTDEEVLAYARSMLGDDSTMSASRALRKLRDEEQRACEQGRFGRLFGDAKRDIRELQELPL